ncbi:hypothetical protein F0562_001607 [Nyssa sinensis]|uniref:Retrotransposon gag domain-containing protein n=1 Tax=Nyssa sinensis TaxID=561372 RepID=A0A5J5C3F1_9ASTE|nr:hypothetical protein F0562_001607 [Nyssa sinensis]
MAEGTRLSQLSETVNNLQGVTTALKEEQSRHGMLIEGVLQQLNNLASSYDSLDFPRFDGGDPSEWILKVQQFFNYFETPEDHKLEIASFHMEGKALTWYYWLKKSSPVTKWGDFVEALRTKFGPSAYEDPVGAFTKLRQTGSVEDYQTAFEILSNKISGVSEEFRISTFLSGLKDELRIIVTMFKPNTLAAAFGLARLQEEEVTRKQYPYRNTQAQNSPYTPSSKPTPLRLPGQNPIPRLPAPNPVLRLPAPQNPRPSPPFQRRNPYPIKRISPNQMQERREKGLCYFCDEKYHQGHKCSKPKLYLLEGMEFEGEGEEELEEEKTFKQPDTEIIPAVQQAEMLGISLHAIAGAPSPKTMRLVGKIGTCSVIVLIDTGSTHSFIDVNVARRAKLPMEEGHLAVQVANGDTLPCFGCCKAVLLKMQSL